MPGKLKACLLNLFLTTGLFSSSLYASDISAVWANEGGDKVTQDELRASNHQENLTGNVINRAWDGTTISLSGARNEVVSFNLVLEAATSTATNVTVSFNALQGPNGTIANTTQASGNGVFDWVGRPIELFYVRYLQIQGLSYFGYGKWDERQIPKRFERPWTGNGVGSGTWLDRPDHDKFYPDIMVPLELVQNFNIQAGQNQSIWGDIYIPKTATPGVYTGVVTVQENGVPAYLIPLKLQVYNFALPDTPSAKTMANLDTSDIMWRYVTGYQGYVNWQAPGGQLVRAITDRYFQLFHRHKISLIGENECAAVDSPCDFSLARLNGNLFTAQNGYDGPGVGTGVNVYGIGIYGTWSWRSGATEASMWQHTDNWASWFQNNSPSTEYFLYLEDEPAPQDYAQVETWAEWMAADPGPGNQVLSMSTHQPSLARADMPTLEVPVMPAGLGACPGNAVPCNVTATNEAAADFYAGTPGRRLWAYNDSQPGTGCSETECDGIAFRQIAWTQYKKNIERWFYWYVNPDSPNDWFQQAVTWGSNQYYDSSLGEYGTDGRSNGNGLLVYPGTDLYSPPSDSYGVDGPFASLRLKEWRRGIQDVDYLTLAAQVDPAGTQAIVNQIIPQVLWEYPASDPGYYVGDISWSVDPDVWEAARAQLAQIILNGQGIIFFDSPNAQTSPYLGVANFSGWAINSTAAIQNLAVSIDGIPVGTANYNLSRPDVCAAYPGQVGCPNVGWSFSYDTTNLSNGVHTLSLFATLSSGLHQTGSSSFTVANWSPASLNPIHISIDRPNSSNPGFAGLASFGGWALDDVAAIAGVTVSIDGVSLGNAAYGGSRPDVCNAFPNRQGCPNVGWNFALDTTLLPDGTHTLAITANASSGDHSTATASFTVANMTAQNPIHLFIDTPNRNSGSFSGSVQFAGWAEEDNASLSSVAVAVDGVPFGNANYTIARPDVCNVYPAGGNCPNVGWNFLLDTRLLANGNHTLEVTATSAAGAHATIATSFAVANSASNPTRIFIDQPSGQSSVLEGTTVLAGWAINDNSAVSSVSIFIDGTSFGNANYGISRSDVCTAFPGRPGCPNVGWSLLLDTTLLSNGVHNLTVSATTSSEFNVVSTTFTVANWTNADPFHINIDSPNAQSPPLTGSSAHLGGWAINDNSSIASVSLSIDGVPIGTAAYGGSRPDVCNAYPNRPGCPNVGWNFSLDTTALADGAHTLDVIAASSDGQHSLATTTFQVANLPGSPLRIDIDRPNAQTPPLYGSAAFGGWALDDNAPITSVTISVDGVAVGPAIYGGTRPDVCAAFPNRPGCPNVGWNFILDTTAYTNGTHTLDVTVTAADGRSATQSASFTVAN